MIKYNIEETDIPIVKNTEEMMKKDNNRRMALLVLVGLHGLGLLWGVLGWWIYQSDLVILFVLTIHVIDIVSFEIAYRKYEHEPQSRRFCGIYTRGRICLFGRVYVVWLCIY